MKAWITQTAAGVLALASISLMACKKDEVQAVATPANSATLKASITSAVLQSTDGTQDAITYTWTPVTLSWSGTDNPSTYSPVTYTLQFDKKGNNFAAPVSVDGGAGPTKKLTVAALNSSLIGLGLAPEVPADVETRLRVTYANNIAPLYSPATALHVTPYSTELYVSSSYLNNVLTSAPKLVEIDGSPRQYQGYAYFGGTSASTFKVTNTRAGTGSFYGSSNSTTSIAAQPVGTAVNGSLASPGNNFSIAPGFYLLKVNLNAMTWTATPTTWGIIGSATPGGWNADTPMTYDATKNVWTVTTTLTAASGDAFKFRANNAWAVNLGDLKPTPGSYLVQDGENIASPGAGRYTITLNFSDSSKPTYTLSK